MKKTRISFCLCMICLLLFGVIALAAESGNDNPDENLPELNTGIFLDSQGAQGSELYGIEVIADNEESNRTVTANGAYPGEPIGLYYWWPRVVGSQGYTFTVTIDYKHPFANFSSVTGGAYVDNCEHVPENHTVRCTGAFPAQNPSKELTGDMTLWLVATCALYNNPQTKLVFAGGIDYSDGAHAGTQVSVDVRPKIETSLLGISPNDGAKEIPISSNGLGPKLNWSLYSGNPVCNCFFPFPDFADIYYYVYLRPNGGQWQRIGLGQDVCSRQVQLGPNDLECLNGGDPQTYEWRIDVVDLAYQTCTGPTQYTQKFTTGSCRTTIDVLPQFGDYFLSGLNVNNIYKVNVMWNGSAYPDPPTAPYGNVLFDLNGNITQVPGQSWGADHAYDMGADFNASLLGGNNTLRIKAVNSQGGESLETVLQPMVFPVPAWITSFALGNFQVDLASRTVKYERSVEYPDPHFKARYLVPNWVPYLGGANMGIVETYATLGASACSDGSGTAGLGGNTGIEITENKKVSGSVSGNGSVRFGKPKGLDLESASFGLAIAGEISEEMGIADLVPGLKSAENWWLVGRIVKWFNKRATVEASIEPSVEIGTTFKNKGSGLAFDNGAGEGKLKMELSLALRILESLKGSVTGGGEPRVKIQVPADGPWGYLQEIAIRLYAKAAITVWRFEKEWERGITCSLPTGNCETDEGEDRAILDSNSDWNLIGRDYASQDYAILVANSIPTMRSSGSTTETLIINNVYPLAQPALAVRDDGNRMLLWVHDDTGKPIAQGEEIFAGFWDGATWITDTLTYDNLQDFSPQVAFDSDGDAVAIWERNTTVQVSPSLDVTYTQSIEIAAAAWDSGAESWSAVSLLTDNSLLDAAPQLARGQDGVVLALWRTGDGTDFLGIDGHPIDLNYAVWDGNAWNAPAAAVSNLTDTLSVDLAVYSSTQAALVLTRDTDGDLLTGSDMEIYYSTWDGADWSELEILTGDAITDSVPSISYNADGQPVIVWLRDTDLVMQTGWTGSPTVVRPSSDGSAFLDYDLLSDPDGNLALVWQQTSPNGTKIVYAIYDASNSSWSGDKYMLEDDAMEESISPAFGNDGALQMAYNKVSMTHITKTIVVSPTLSYTVTGILEPEQTDLAFLSHTIETDLGIRDGDIALSDPNPAPGSSVTISATVHNLGDLAVVGGEVAFYDGDPNTSGVQIGVTRTLTSPLPAASSETVTVEWDVPTTTISHELYVVVDPTDAVTEDNESNNQAAVDVVLPDLIVDWTFGGDHTTDSVTLTAIIQNAGWTPAAAPFMIAYFAEEPSSGTLLGSVTITDDLQIGQTITASLTLTDPALYEGVSDIFWVVADAESDILEADEDNNTNYGRLAVLPDLTLTAADFEFEQPVSDTITVTIQLLNIGVFTSTNVTLSVWQNGFTGTLVYSDTIGAIAPAGMLTTTLNATLTDETISVWALVDSTDFVDEMDETNNLAIRALDLSTEGPFEVFLPLVMK
ncbi:MAG: hypothetical protein JXA42_19495 [Anaerolineales bacterium]|nr:hypothetical protein [Anaerolineales bacterium]